MSEIWTWLRVFAEEVGHPPPDRAVFDQVLRLAAVAARSSARQAAPVACWLAGAAGMDLEEAIRVAESIDLGDESSGGASGG